MSTPLEKLKHHVTGAIERGEKEAIEVVINPLKFTSDEINRLQALVQERLCYPALRATEEEALTNIDNKLAEMLGTLEG